MTICIVAACSSGGAGEHGGSPSANPSAPSGAESAPTKALTIDATAVADHIASLAAGQMSTCPLAPEAALHSLVPTSLEAKAAGIFVVTSTGADGSAICEFPLVGDDAGESGAAFQAGVFASSRSRETRETKLKSKATDVVEIGGGTRYARPDDGGCEAVWISSSSSDVEISFYVNPLGGLSLTAGDCSGTLDAALPKIAATLGG